MKELSIEEKAKRYDEAIERAKNYYSTTDSASVIKLIGLIFPELKESEDERIRKAIHIYLDWLDGKKDYAPRGEYTINDMIDWIEKQGKHQKFRDSIQVGDKVTRNEDGVLVNLSQLNRVAKKDEKQGEQSPIDVRTTGYWHVEDVEQNPAWSEEDERIYKVVLELIDSYSKGTIGGCIIPPNVERYAKWFKALKDRVLPKSTWSEEDEAMWAEISNLLWEGYKHSGSKFSWDDIRNWINPKLKSLRPQNTWKPSEGQLECLGYAIEKAEKDWSPLTNNRIYLTLKALKEQLLELRGSKV